MNYLFITIDYWIDIEAFKSILNWIELEASAPSTDFLYD